MKTIYTDSHILLLDETKDIKKGYAIIHHTLCKIEQREGKFVSRQLVGGATMDIAKSEYQGIVIAAHPPIKGCYEFETLPTNTDDDVEKLAKEQSNNQAWINGFITGHNQAKSETMFSLEDMNQALLIGARNHINPKKAAHLLHEYTQSLTKPKEYEFVPEMEIWNTGNLTSLSSLKPKIINNKVQGKWKPKSTN